MKEEEQVEKLILDGSVDVRTWQEDDLSVRLAAANARIPYNRLSTIEEKIFADVLKNKVTHNAYLMIRNKLIEIWTHEPNIEITAEFACREVLPILHGHKRLIRRVHAFLTRHGHINYGHFYMGRGPLSVKKKVIIIGSGAAGLAAAKQLRYFGFQVVVLEGRNRVGGRMQTFSIRDPQTGKVTASADMGAMIVTGILGNPMVTVMKQIDCYPVRLKTACPIYDETGKPVEGRRDHLVERAFRDVGDALSYLVHTEGFTTIKTVFKGGEKNRTQKEFLSLEKGYQLVLEQMELRAQRKRNEFWRSYNEIAHKLQDLQKEIAKYTKAVAVLVAKMKRFEDLKEDIENQNEADLLTRLQKYELTEAYRRLDAARDRRLGLVTTLKDLKKNEPSVVYMNLKDRRLLDFHYANLEYANGTSLENLSAEHWDQDDQFQMAGSHSGVVGGYGAFMERFSELSSVNKYGPSAAPQLNSVVTDVIYGEKEVKVKYHKADNKEEVLEMTADAVIVTTPLGVLKKEEEFRFEPPLPDEKRAAIQKMGFGNLNKVVLFFEKPFWNTEQNFFGHLNPSSQSRGEFFLFTSMEDQPVLIALMSGHAAFIDQEKHQVIVKNAMTVLQSIFGTQIPKLPLEAVVTRWHEDPFAYGCYSHVPPGGSGKLYDDLAAPVCAKAADGSHSGAKRLFFAGEHTFRKAPATVPGAWLSGIRAAAEIADEFLGVPFSAENFGEQVDLIDLLSSDDESDVEIVEPSAPQQPQQPEQLAKMEDDDDIIPMDPGPPSPPTQSPPVLEKAENGGVVTISDNDDDDDIQFLS